MIEFFYDLTMQNWGFPYHVLFGLILAQLCYGGFYLWLENRKGMKFHFLWYGILSWFAVNFVGYLNELLDKDKTEFWQDTIANNIGILLAFVLLYLIKKVVKK